jgi:hypothetical protein
MQHDLPAGRGECQGAFGGGDEAGGHAHAPS